MATLKGLKELEQFIKQEIDKRIQEWELALEGVNTGNWVLTIYKDGEWHVWNETKDTLPRSDDSWFHIGLDEIVGKIRERAGGLVKDGEW